MVTFVWAWDTILMKDGDCGATQQQNIKECIFDSCCGSIRMSVKYCLHITIVYREIRAIKQQQINYDMK
jgi:hypothetical protein